MSITGGEPLLAVEVTRDLLSQLREQLSPVPKLWLYTSIYRAGLMDLLPYLDGVQYTLHAPASARDIEELGCTERLLAQIMQDRR